MKRRAERAARLGEKLEPTSPKEELQRVFCGDFETETCHRGIHHPVLFTVIGYDKDAREIKKEYVGRECMTGFFTDLLSPNSYLNNAILFMHNGSRSLSLTLPSSLG